SKPVLLDPEHAVQVLAGGMHDQVGREFDRMGQYRRGDSTVDRESCSGTAAICAAAAISLRFHSRLAGVWSCGSVIARAPEGHTTSRARASGWCRLDRGIAHPHQSRLPRTVSVRPHGAIAATDYF